MTSEYSIVFDGGSCAINDKKSGQSIASISMTHNRIFPVDVSNFVNDAFIVKGGTETNLWHLRYRHLNMNGLRPLSKKEMVAGLRKISELDFCEGCILEKQNRNSFLVGKSWRASDCLELVHADLYGSMKTESLGGSQYFLLFIDDYSRMS